MDRQQVALAMFLDDDDVALRRYKAGDRTSNNVLVYFERMGIVDLVVHGDHGLSRITAGTPLPSR